jgi:hypothetical protein
VRTRLRRGCVALAAVGLLACSRDSAKRSTPPEATPPASRRVAACSLVTEAEVAQAVGRAVVKATAQDTIFEPGYWSSSCTFQLAAGPAASHVVTVGTSGDYPTVADGAELADAVSAEAMGITARPLGGFSFPAAIYPDTGVVVQQGALRLVVSGASRDAVTALATTAVSRLP